MASPPGEGNRLALEWTSTELVEQNAWEQYERRGNYQDETIRLCAFTLSGHFLCAAKGKGSNAGSPDAP